MPVDFSQYVSVDERIAAFREKHPHGSLQPANPKKPFDVVAIGGEHFIAYTAAAYRDSYDERPGIGTAWEPFPGKTNFTRDSELQNAETSAWGRAIVAALAADTKRGIASADEVRNRNGSSDGGPVAPVPDDIGAMSVGEVAKALRDRGETPRGTPDDLRGRLAALVGSETVGAAEEAGSGNAPDTSGALTTSDVVSPSSAAPPLHASGMALADAAALASAPCYLCGSVQSKRVTDAHGRVRCSNVLGCEKRQRDLDQDDAASAERDLQLGEAVE